MQPFATPDADPNPQSRGLPVIGLSFNHSRKRIPGGNVLGPSAEHLGWSLKLHDGNRHVLHSRFHSNHGIHSGDT